MLRVLNKREKIILYAAFGVIGFSIIFNLFLAPLLSRGSGLNRDIRSARAKLKKYIRLLANKDYLREQYSKVTPRLNTQESAGDPFLAGFSELEELAKEANIHILDIRPQSSRSGSSHKEILIDLRAEGSMDCFFRFIYNLENSPFLFRIKNCQLNAKAGSPLLEGIFSLSQAHIPD